MLETEGVPRDWNFVDYYVSTTLEEQEENHYKLLNVDMFSTFSYLTYHELGNQLAKKAASEVLSRDCDGDPDERRLFFWVHAPRIDAELSNLFDDEEGMFASADKARMVLESYDRFLAGNREQAGFPDEGSRPFGIPQHGSREQWHRVVELMLWKRYGKEYVGLIGDIYGEK